VPVSDSVFFVKPKLKGAFYEDHFNSIYFDRFDNFTTVCLETAVEIMEIHSAEKSHHHIEKL